MDQCLVHISPVGLAWLSRPAAPLDDVRSKLAAVIGFNADYLPRPACGEREIIAQPADPAQLIADLQRQLAECGAERDAGLAREVALAEVLQTTNSSPGDLGPVFDAVFAKAHALCGFGHGALVTYDGEYFRLAADRGMPQFWIKQFREPYRAAPTF